MNWFRRRKPGLAERLQGTWRCAGCGGQHTGLSDLAALAPDPWPHGSAREENGAIRLDGDFLSEDFCVMGGRYFFVRAVLEIPVLGLAEKFGFGCWSTLSRDDFDRYLDGFDSGAFSDWGPWDGWLCNRLATFVETKPERVLVYPQPARQRPTLLIDDPAHPLAIVQGEGMTAERLIDVLRVYGHVPTG